MGHNQGKAKALCSDTRTHATRFSSFCFSCHRSSASDTTIATTRFVVGCSRRSRPATKMHVPILEGSSSRLCQSLLPRSQGAVPSVGWPARESREKRKGSQRLRMERKGTTSWLD